jgi:hypothetical protein
MNKRKKKNEAPVTGMEIPIFTPEFLEHNKGSFAFFPYYFALKTYL